MPLPIRHLWWSRSCSQSQGRAENYQPITVLQRHAISTQIFWGVDKQKQTRKQGLHIANKLKENSCIHYKVIYVFVAQ